MLRNTVLLAALVLAPAFAAAQVPYVKFDFFDSPATQGKKFEEAFKQNDRITGINIDGRSFMLHGEWTVMNSWFVLSEIGGTGRPISTGYLVLGRVKDKTLYDIMRVDVSLQPNQRNEYKKTLSASCLTESNVLHQEVVRAEDKYQSCARIRSFKYEDLAKDPGRMELAIINYSKVNGLAMPKVGDPYYSTLMVDTKNAAGVYVVRWSAKADVPLDDLIAFTKSLRSSIRSSFFKE